MSFNELGVAKWLSEALDAMKIYKPTSIQSACIPQILKGHDCIGGAKQVVVKPLHLQHQC